MPSRRRRWATGLAIGALALTVTAGAALVGVRSGPDHTVAPVAGRLDTTVHLPLLGRFSNNSPRDWNVFGADLGFTFAHDEAIYMVFGDTFGIGGTEGHDWRSNTMARVLLEDVRNSPVADVTFAEMITGPGGNAAELLSSQKHEGVEKTVIPSAGISLGDQMLLHFMSVRRWVRPGLWTANHSGVATSENGRNWIVQDEPRWDGDSNFVHGAFAEQGPYVYFAGAPAGRFGGLAIARVHLEQILDEDRWQYWDDERWRIGEPDAVQPIVPAPVGEPTLRWSPHYKRWILMYLDERRGAIVLRTANRVQGPWSAPYEVLNNREMPQLYAPALLAGTGSDATLSFTLSTFDPYTVHLASLELDEDVLGQTPAPGGDDSGGDGTQAGGDDTAGA